MNIDNNMYSHQNLFHLTVDSPSLCVMDKGMKESEEEVGMHGGELFCS
jgi:hypothetical protein